MKKVIFVIPGFRQKTTSRAYKEIVRILKKEGYTPILVAIQWKNSTISENSEYFLKRYKKVDARKKYILGFSYGAMIAFIAGTKVNAEGIVLCSLSPYFQEDIKKLKDPKTTLMEKRFEDFEKFHSRTLAKKLKTKKILMLYGGLEARTLIKRVTETFQDITIPTKTIIKIKKAEHNIGHARYLQTIHKVASELL